MIAVDPYSYHFLRDQLLCKPPQVWDGRGLPIYEALVRIQGGGKTVHTSDYLSAHPGISEPVDFYSLGMLSHRELRGRPNVRFKAFVVHEPPVFAPRLYRILPELTSVFERVYVHNLSGDCYSLKGVDQSKLRKLYFPIPFNHVLMPFWARQDRIKKLVIINSLQNPWIYRCVDMVGVQSARGLRLNTLSEIFDSSFTGEEFYSYRIHAVAALAGLSAIDLYGMHWRLALSPRIVWPTYLLNYRRLMSVYKGPTESKFATLSKYAFSLVIENTAMKSCLSEKLFDCFYAGSIPVFVGPADVADFLPPESFIDARRIGDWRDVWTYLQSLNPRQIENFREAGRAVFTSGRAQPFFDFYNQVFS
ncbi:MAG: hypothetical protein C5B49_12965 [Bdellovibrio sp.]|nr:MAG: hypothetical protein C5B49_12965 [Bdellovibrio sp.]